MKAIINKTYQHTGKVSTWLGCDVELWASGDEMVGLDYDRIVMKRNDIAPRKALSKSGGNLRLNEIFVAVMPAGSVALWLRQWLSTSMSK
jgi:hypothetical protein